jgi:hypothetical protein
MLGRPLTGSISVRPATITNVNHPGLAKAGALPSILSRTAVMVLVRDGYWRSLFERADIVSEGAEREESDQRVWYGSTSIILPTGADTARFAVLAAYDAHARTRALRAARREACSRAPHPLGRLACDLHFSADPRGVRIDVDVQAPLMDRTTAFKATP